MRLKSADQSMTTDVSRLRLHRCTIITSIASDTDCGGRIPSCASALDKGHQSKMNRPCGLRTAEEIQQSRIRRCNRWGHREARQDHERERNENDDGVAELLQEAVGWPAAHPWHRKSRMCGDVAPHIPRRKLSKAGDKVAPEVPACESHDQVHQAAQDEEPGCQEVEAS